MFGWFKRKPACECKTKLALSHIERTTLTETVVGATLNWALRPDLYFEWTGVCKHCGEPIITQGLASPWRDDLHWPRGYTRDDNGWPVDPDGRKVEIAA
jgi:hypothetical protein